MAKEVNNTLITRGHPIIINRTETTVIHNINTFSCYTWRALKSINIVFPAEKKKHHPHLGWPENE